MSYRMTGTLRRGVSPDTIEGSLQDPFGTSFLITGHRAAGAGDHVWTEGVCADGAAILRDGIMMPISAILHALNKPGSYDLEAVPGPMPDGLKLPWEEKAG